MISHREVHANREKPGDLRNSLIDGRKHRLVLIASPLDNDDELAVGVCGPVITDKQTATDAGLALCYVAQMVGPSNIAIIVVDWDGDEDHEAYIHNTVIPIALDGKEETIH